MEFFEEKFYGSRPFEMAIMPKEGYEVTDLALLLQQRLGGSTQHSTDFL